MSGDPVSLGSNVTITLVARHGGGVEALNVFTSTTLPVGLSLVSMTTTVGSRSSTGCSFGSMSSGGSATVTIVARANVVGFISVDSGVGATNPDPITGNNRVCAFFTVKAPFSARTLTIADAKRIEDPGFGDQDSKIRLIGTITSDELRCAAGVTVTVFQSATLGASNDISVVPSSVTSDTSGKIDGTIPDRPGQYYRLSIAPSEQDAYRCSDATFSRSANVDVQISGGGLKAPITVKSGAKGAFTAELKGTALNVAIDDRYALSVAQKDVQANTCDRGVGAIDTPPVPVERSIAVTPINRADSGSRQPGFTVSGALTDKGDKISRHGECAPNAVIVENRKVGSSGDWSTVGDVLTRGEAGDFAGVLNASGGGLEWRVRVYEDEAAPYVCRAATASLDVPAEPVLRSMTFGITTVAPGDPGADLGFAGATVRVDGKLNARLPGRVTGVTLPIDGFGRGAISYVHAWKTGEKTTDSKVVSSAASPAAPYFVGTSSFDVALVPVPSAISVSVHFDSGYEKNCLRAAPVRLGLAAYDNEELDPDNWEYKTYDEARNNHNRFADAHPKCKYGWKVVVLSPRKGYGLRCSNFADALYSAAEYLAVYYVEDKIPVPGTEDLLWAVLDNIDSVDPDKQSVEQDALDSLAETYGLPKSKKK